MIGLDLAKNVFHVHGVDAAGKVTVSRKLRRAKVETYFAGLPPCVVGMEACGGAHYWARVIERHGHEVRLMPAHYVTPYVKRNKTDTRDAEAICEGMGRPTMRFVPVKNEEQQAMMALHRTRALLVRQRTMTANALRCGLAEFGIVAAQGDKGLRTLMEQLAAEHCPIPALARVALSVLAVQWKNLEGAICELERRILLIAREQEVTRRLMEVPGVGPLVASVVAAKVPNASVFRTSRDFAAWCGLTPQQHSTGGKQRSGSISKKGDRTLRQLLIMGASSRLAHASRGGTNDPWLRALLGRRPFKVAVIALAAKMARIIWALLKTGEHYRSQVQHQTAPAAA
jgi:transposase